MKTSSGFAIFKYIVLLLLTTAMGACSFKKNPNAGKTPIVVMQAPETPARAKTVEEIIAGADEDLAIQELTQNKELGLKGMHGESLLDLAIKYDKLNVIKFLLLQGDSPFAISEDSYRKLEYSDSLNLMLSTAQDDALMDVIRSYPGEFNGSFTPDIESRSIEKFRKRIAESQLGPRGCQKLVGQLVDLKFFREKTQFAGAYYVALEMMDIQNVVRNVILETQCSEYKSRFSMDLVAKWLGYELLLQYQNNFTSSDFIRFLISLGASSIDMTLPNYSRTDSFDSSHVKINPTSLLMLKAHCFSDEGSFRSWLDLLKTYNKKNDDDFVGRYSFPEDWTDDLACKGDRIHCLQNKANAQSLYSVYRVLNPTTKFNSESFVEGFTKLSRFNFNNSPPIEDLRVEICKVLKEPGGSQ